MAQLPLPNTDQPSDPSSAIEVPTSVVEALLAVSRDARASMGDQQAVARLAYFYGGNAAFEWIATATPAAYIAALRALGARVRADHVLE